MRDSLLEHDKSFRLLYAERRQLGGGDILVFEGSQVEAFVPGIQLVGDDFCGEVQVLFVFFTTLGFELFALGIKALLCIR